MLLNEKILPTNSAAEKTIQRVVSILKKCNKTVVNRHPSPWREKFQSFSLYSRELLYMDNRLVIPQSMKQMMMCSLHYGHPGRNAMLSMLADYWKKEHEEAFLKSIQKMNKTSELSHFKRDKEIRIIYEASKQGLDAVLQQM